MKRRTGMFSAVGDDSCQYTVHILTDFIDASSHDDPRAVIKGMKELRTSDGMAVDRLQKGEYKIIQTGIILHSTDPAAP